LKSGLLLITFTWSLANAQWTTIITNYYNMTSTFTTESSLGYHCSYRYGAATTKGGSSSYFGTKGVRKVPSRHKILIISSILFLMMVSRLRNVRLSTVIIATAVVVLLLLSNISLNNTCYNPNQYLHKSKKKEEEQEQQMPPL
jgi:hypothetical protein